MELDILKIRLIQKAKGYFRQKNLEVYPLHTQINVANGVEEDATQEEIQTFLTTAKTEFSALKDAINSLEDSTILSDFQTDSDANMINFVANKLPDLTTERQKLAIVVAIQTVK